MNTASHSKLSSPINDYLAGLHQKYAAVREGTVASYIPELAKADPEWFGLCLVTTGGHVYEVGDSRQEFTIQSVSKPFVYGLALEDNTRAEVLEKVGVEPTGDVFNAISFEPVTGRPMNPMINAGAIAAAGLVAGKTLKTRQQRILDVLGLYAGRELSIDEAVYQSESETGHRNRAIGHMLRNFNILTEPPEPVVDLYFKQCSVLVTCRDLAVMAATLANRGVNPISGKRAIRGEYVESVLSVMATCGMYDYAGEWIYRVGMPAKSGVGGGVIAVLPGELGIGVFSPPLDSHGNSVRGLRVFDDLSRYFDLHLFNNPHSTNSVIRLRFSGAEVTSSRVRAGAEAEVLRDHGDRIRVYQLQENLTFSTTEVFVSEMVDAAEKADFIIADFKHVVGINESGVRLLCQAMLKFAGAGKKLVFARTNHLPNLRRYMKRKLGDQFDAVFRAFDDNETALEWCENSLIEAHLPLQPGDRAVSVEEYELCKGLTPEEVQTLASLFQRREYRRGEVMVQFGAAASELFFLATGTASVTVTLSSGLQKRLATFSAGMSFGEMAILDRAPRSAVVTADTDVVCDLLRIESFEELGKAHPRIHIVLLRNLAFGLCQKLRKANREISVFDY